MSLPDLAQSALAVRLVQALAHVLWEGLVLLAFAYGLNAVLRRLSARVKYAVWFVTLCLMLLCLPANLLVLSALRSEAPQPPSDGLGITPLALVDQTLARPADTSELVGESQTSSPRHVSTHANPVDSVSRTQSPHIPLPGTQMLGFWHRISPYVLPMYVLGLLAMLLRLLIAVRGGWRLRADSVVVEDGAFLSRIDQYARQMGLRTRPVVAYCQRIMTPVVVGVVKPAVLLPVAFASQLRLEQLEAILRHEFAHIRRWDPVMNLVQRLVEVVLFFHPAVWLASRPGGHRTRTLLR